MDEKEIIKGLKVVCKCKAVRYKTIKNAILNGAKTLDDIRIKTGANTGCGKLCTREILNIIEEYSNYK